MYEWVQAGARSYYIDCPAKIGVFIAGESNVFLIDSGSDKDVGKKVKRILDGRGLRLSGILNTHSHADHIGGNAYLQGQTNCPVFAGAIEGDFVRHPVLEPSLLYGGYPCKPLRHKFLLAQESAALGFSDPGFPQEVEVLPLPGHSFDMAGFRTPDGTAFIGDCVSSRATLDKYGVPFIYDVGAYLATLDRIEAMEAALFVPSHAEATADIAPLARYNRSRVLEIADRLVDICREPIGTEEVLRRIFLCYHLTMNFQQYALIGSTIRSYLSWLSDSGRITAAFEDQRLLWQAAS